MNRNQLFFIARNDIRTITMVGSTAGNHCVMRFVRMKWCSRLLGPHRLAFRQHFYITLALQNELHLVEEFLSERNLYIGQNSYLNQWIAWKWYFLSGQLCSKHSKDLRNAFRWKFGNGQVPWFRGIVCNNKNRIQWHPTHWQPGSRHTEQWTLLAHCPC